MGVLRERIDNGRTRPGARRSACLCLLILPALLVLPSAQNAWALQRHTLTPGESSELHSSADPQQAAAQSLPGDAHGAMQGKSSGPVIHLVQQAPESGHGDIAAPQPPAPQPHGAQPAQPHAPAPGQPAPKSQAPGTMPPAHPPAGGAQPAEPGHEAAPGKGEEHGAAQGGHGPALPEISPIPGVSFVETMINLMQHELKERTFGWRPNDLAVGRFTDNVNYYQLGVLEALRFTTLRLKDSLTRMGDADAYDPDLEAALNLFMNRSTLFWFPSAETSYSEAIDHLRLFQQKLRIGQRNFYYRVDNLLSLMNTYKDLLGNVNRNLVRPVGFFEADDYFYYAKGVAHVYYEILRVVRVGYHDQLAATLNALAIMDEIIHELYRAEAIDPWIILNADLGGLLANHRANLNAPLGEVAHLLGVLGRF